MTNKQKKKLIRTSILFWIGILMLYASIFVPLAPKIAEWSTNLKTMIILLAIAFPLTAQVAIIMRYKKE